MTEISKHEILTDLAGILSNFQGREYTGEIGPESHFYRDLGFGSIHAVVLGEKLEEFYGRKLPFHEFLAELGRRKVKDLQIGELIEFLHRSLNGRG